jgi:ElaB/YqjD/DUF883 family membrane-anchored ribosome-binding protein
MRPRQRLDRTLRRLLGNDKPEPAPYRPRTTDLNYRPSFEEEAADLDAMMRARYVDSPILVEGHNLPNRLQPMPAAKLAAMQAGDKRATEQARPIRDQQARIESVWSRAIDSLPKALRLVLDQARAAIDETDQELATKLLRLTTLPDEQSEIYVQRRAALSSAVDGLEELLATRKADYRRLCRNAADRLDTLLAREIEQAEQAEATARDRYQALLAESRAELGRLDAERRALGAVRAALDDPAAIESRLGLVVTVKADAAAERNIERTRRQSVVAALRRGTAL